MMMTRYRFPDFMKVLSEKLQEHKLFVFYSTTDRLLSFGQIIILILHLTVFGFVRFRINDPWKRNEGRLILLRNSRNQLHVFPII